MHATASAERSVPGRCSGPSGQQVLSLPLERPHRDSSQTAEGTNGLFRTSNIYSRLEERELSAEEEAIIAERVAFQKSLWVAYEKREMLRKVKE